MCQNGEHQLEDILEYDETAVDWCVVRWCRECGGIVIDVDYDDRTNSGQVMRMKFPRIIDELVELQEKYLEVIGEAESEDD